MPDPSTVIQQFLHPPFGVLTLEHIAGGPFTHGTYAFNRPRGPVHVDAFGMLWSTTLVAIGEGGTPGLVFEYEDRVLELSATYQLLDSTFIQGQRLATHLDTGIWMFDQVLPYGIDCIIGPPFGVDLWWLLAL